MPRLTHTETDVVNESTSTTTRHCAALARQAAPVGPHSKLTSASDCPRGSPPPGSTTGVSAFWFLGLASAPEFRRYSVLVVGTGVDPVTSRFSGARSTN